MFLETPSGLLDSEPRATLLCPGASPPPWGLARPCLHLVTGGPPPPQGPPEPPERSRPIKHDAATCGVLAFKLTALSHPLATALMCDLTGFTGSSQWAGGLGGDMYPWAAEELGETWEQLSNPRDPLPKPGRLTGWEGM